MCYVKIILSILSPPVCLLFPALDRMSALTLVYVFVGSTVQAQPIKAPLRTAAAQSLIHEEKIKPKYVTAAIEDLVKAEGKLCHVM